MKVALLSIVSEEDAIKQFVQKMCPPLGLFYIESYLKKHLPLVEVFISTDVNTVLEFKPQVIGISSVTENFCIALKTIEKIKNLIEVPVIIGGVHISLLPESLPSTCDIGVIGEGEETILELLKIFLTSGRFEESKLKDVKGIVFRRSDGSIIINSVRPLIRPLDLIPWPERHTLDLLKITHVISSRGCPYRCVFCSTSTFWNCYRTHSARYVADELKSIMKNVSPPHIKFFDDLFIADKERLRQLVGFVSKEGLRPPYGFSCFVRSELLNHEMLSLLKEMGFTGVAIGIESASPVILKMLKGQSTVEHHQSALNLCKEYGLNTTVSVILGMPGEKEEDLQMTYDFLEENEDKITEIEICPVVPFPGTKLWDYALKKGFVSPDMDWSLLEDYSIFTQFKPDRYIYLNEDMKFEVFYDYCFRFLNIYKHFWNKSAEIYKEIYFMEKEK
ncbi:MAG TPA: radical SAM protein [Candidatus Eremiobacteraeota bacterium]|nr:MAG: Threonylcarbamoyladenosine tRNA methylthiotransferase MtaB [bacterium ADurb.Bin363]HPZ07016.1 radical SAM protein [Candidatus Eremiobacteraeota bacterium]